MSGLSLQKKTRPGATVSPVTHHCCPPCKDPAWSQGPDSLAGESSRRAAGCLQPPGLISIHTQEAPARDCSAPYQGGALPERGVRGGGVVVVGGGFPDCCRVAPAVHCLLARGADEQKQECLRVWTLPSPDTAGQSHGPPASAGAMLSAQEGQIRGPTRSSPVPTRLDGT